MKNINKSKNLPEIIAAISLAILSISSFALQAVTATTQTSPKETALFGALQFVLTTGFAYFSTRAISRADFEASLKRFAISAYRRIADIEQMTTRLKSEVRERMAISGEETCRHLETVDAITGDTLQVVRSSMSDWADVIGEELLALEKLKRLKIERDELSDKQGTNISESREVKEKIEEVEIAISNIVKALPPRLAISAAESESEELLRHHASWVASDHYDQNGLKLSVVAGDDYPTDRLPETIKPDERLIAELDKHGRFNIRDEKGNYMGRLQNHSPLDYDSFVSALRRCYNRDQLDLLFVKNGDSEVRSGKQFYWYTVKISNAPDLNTPKRSNAVRRTKSAKKEAS